MPLPIDRPLTRRSHGLTIPPALSSRAEKMVGLAEILMICSLGAALPEEAEHRAWTALQGVLTVRRMRQGCWKHLQI